jgi:hypothetical protein
MLLGRTEIALCLRQLTISFSIRIQCIIEFFFFFLANLPRQVSCDATAVQVIARFAAFNCSTRATALRLWPVFHVYKASLHDNDIRAVCVLGGKMTKM